MTTKELDVNVARERYAAAAQQASSREQRERWVRQRNDIVRWYERGCPYALSGADRLGRRRAWTEAIHPGRSAGSLPSYGWTLRDHPGRRWVVAEWCHAFQPKSRRLLFQLTERLQGATGRRIRRDLIAHLAARRDTHPEHAESSPIFAEALLWHWIDWRYATDSVGDLPRWRSVSQSEAVSHVNADLLRRALDGPELGRWGHHVLCAISDGKIDVAREALRRLDDAVPAMARNLGLYLVGVNRALQGAAGWSSPLSDVENAILAELGHLTALKGLTGSKLIERLFARGFGCINQSVLTTRHIPALRERGWQLPNSGGARGYSLSRADRERWIGAAGPK